MARRSAKTFPWQTSGAPENAFIRPPISVVLPVYNQSRYLAAAVRSVLQEEQYQLELIVVDDGSTEDIRAVLDPFASDSRLTLIRQEHNTGLARALNRGFSSAAGAFLTWTSADNEFLPEALSRLADYLRANPSLGFVYGNVRLIDDRGNILAGSSYRVLDQSAGDSSVLELPYSAETLSLYNDNFINSCFLFRRRVLQLVGLYDPKKNGFEDYDFWLRTQLFFPIAHIDTDEPLYRYRLHTESMTSAMREAGLSEMQRESVWNAARRRHQLRESAFDSELSGAPLKELSHRSHARYLDGNADPFPPLRFPALLRRARDGSLGAVTGKAALGAALVFCPDLDADGWRAETIARYVQSYRTLTWVLLCRSAEQRAFADALNRQLRQNDNLRIIDISAESDSDWEPPKAEHLGVEPWQERSLMFALSSVELVCSFLRSLNSRPALVELRIEAALAALAGIPVLAVHESSPEALGDAQTAQGLDVPHLALHHLRTDSLSFESLVRRTVDSVDIASLEQWLDTQSAATVRKQLKALDLAAE